MNHASRENLTEDLGLRLGLGLPVGLESWFTLAPAASRASIAVRFPLEEACMRGVHPFSRHVASRSASSFRAADRVLPYEMKQGVHIVIRQSTHHRNNFGSGSRQPHRGLDLIANSCMFLNVLRIPDVLPDKWSSTQARRETEDKRGSAPADLALATTPYACLITAPNKCRRVHTYFIRYFS